MSEVTLLHAAAPKPILLATPHQFQGEGLYEYSFLFVELGVEAGRVKVSGLEVE